MAEGTFRRQPHTERLRGPELIKSLIADCKCSMWDSCRRGWVPRLKQGWLLIIPGICCPSPACFYGRCLSHHRPVVPPTIYSGSSQSPGQRSSLDSWTFFWFPASAVVTHAVINNRITEQVSSLLFFAQDPSCRVKNHRDCSQMRFFDILLLHSSFGKVRKGATRFNSLLSQIVSISMSVIFMMERMMFYLNSG